MTMIRPFAGLIANWMLQPPVATPTSRRIARPEVAHPLVLAVGQRHRRRDGDRVAGVHAHRVEVLDGADDDGVVVAVPHQLELVLLPAQHTLLDQHRGMHVPGRSESRTCGPSSGRPEGRLRRGQPAAGDPLEIVEGVGHPGAEAAHRERRPDHHRQAEIGDRGAHLGHRVADRRPRHVPADGADHVLEDLPVLAAVDGRDVGADQLDPVLLQHPALVQRDRGVQRGLAAEGGQHRVDREAPGAAGRPAPSRRTRR